MSPTLKRRVGYLAPFAGAVIVSFLLAPLPHGSVLWLEWGLAWLLAAVVAVVVLFTPWRRVSPWWALIPVVLYLGSVGLLREAGGGNASGVGPMVLLPMIWLALHGTRAVLCVALAVVPWVYWAPILILGEGERYPSSGWRLGILLTVIAGLLASAVPRLPGRERALVARLQRLAHEDELTGLPNRRAWDARLEAAVADAARRDEPLCVALIDLDDFKAVNDASGHAAGDRLLSDLAAQWRDATRAADTIARLGGDEFALLLPNADLTDAEAVLQRMRARSSAGWSYGLRRWDGVESAAQLVRRADGALYEAKRAAPGDGRFRERTASSP